MTRKEWYIENLEGKTYDVHSQTTGKLIFQVAFKSIDGWSGDDDQDYQEDMATDLTKMRPMPLNVDRCKDLMSRGLMLPSEPKIKDVLFIWGKQIETIS